MEPRLNSFIYFIARPLNFYEGFNSNYLTIYKARVIAKGSGLCFTEFALREELVDEIRRPIYYDKRKSIFFRTLKEAKKYAESCLKPHKVRYRKIDSDDIVSWDILVDKRG